MRFLMKKEKKRANAELRAGVLLKKKGKEVSLYYPPAGGEREGKALDRNL